MEQSSALVKDLCLAEEDSLIGMRMLRNKVLYFWWGSTYDKAQWTLELS
jgi:hypothetical protein